MSTTMKSWFASDRAEPTTYYIWEHFTKSSLHNEYICTICQKKYNATTRIDSLKKHLNRKHNIFAKKVSKF